MKKSNLTAIMSITIITLFLITGSALADDALYVDPDGNVQIGTAASNSSLEVNGTATVTSMVLTPGVGNYLDANNYAKLYLTAGSNPDANLYAQKNGTSHYAYVKTTTNYGAYLILRSYNSGGNNETIYLLGNSLKPGSDHGTDLGTTDSAWNHGYAAYWHNYADLYLMDDMDDLAILHAIKGSGKIDPVTGLELIDDNTLDERILSKYEEDTPIHPKFDENGEVPEGFVQKYHKKGEIQKTADGKPYFTNLSMFSLLMGATKQLDNKYEDHLVEYDALQAQVEEQQAQIEQLISEIEALKGK